MKYVKLEFRIAEMIINYLANKPYIETVDMIKYFQGAPIVEEKDEKEQEQQLGNGNKTTNKSE